MHIDAGVGVKVGVGCPQHGVLVGGGVGVGAITDSTKQTPGLSLPFHNDAKLLPVGCTPLTVKRRAVNPVVLICVGSSGISTGETNDAIGTLNAVANELDV